MALLFKVRSEFAARSITIIQELVIIKNRAEVCLHRAALDMILLESRASAASLFAAFWQRVRPSQRFRSALAYTL